MANGQHTPDWSPGEIEALRIYWPQRHVGVGAIAQHCLAAGGACLRTDDAIRSKVRALGLPHRRGPEAGMLRAPETPSKCGEAIEAPGPHCEIESDKAARAWVRRLGKTAKFEDDPRVPAAAAPWRGRPPLARSVIGCAARMLAESL